MMRRHLERATGRRRWRSTTGWPRCSTPSSAWRRARRPRRGWRPQRRAAGRREPEPPPSCRCRTIRFCHAADGVRLAYATVGTARRSSRRRTGYRHLEYDWESSLWRHWLHALTRRFRLLRYDERGCGLSDWNTTSFAMEAWVDDLATVVDAAGFERFPMLGVSQGAAVAVEYASRHPERVSALVLYGGYVHGPVARARNDDERRLAELMPQLAELGWGIDEPSFRQVFTARFMPAGSRSAVGRVQRAAAPQYVTDERRPVHARLQHDRRHRRRAGGAVSDARRPRARRPRRRWRRVVCSPR